MRNVGKNRQRGVALLLSLGVLSLLLVSGIAFVAGALQSQRSAAAYRFRTQAQLLGKSSVNRVMMLMRYYLEVGDAEGIGDLRSSINDEAFSDVSDVPAAGRNDQLAAGAGSLLTASVDNSVRNAPAAQWEYLWDAYGADGKRTADAHILGRFAYWVLPAGSVNFSEILRGNTALATGTLSSWSKRRGFGIRELNIGGSAYLTAASLNRLDDRFASETFSATAQDSARASDYATFQSMFDGQNTLALTERNVIRRFLPPSGTEEEVFLYSASYDKESFNPNRADSVTKYHRFDLTRTDWTRLGNASDIGNSDDLVKRLLGDPDATLKERAVGDAVTDTTETTSDCIPALRRIGDAAGAYPSLTVRRKQIAANLIDYCDADSRPTSDSADWNATAPNYTGNEKTPYINEIMVSPSIAVRREEIIIPGAAEVPTKYRYRYTADIGMRLIAAEVVNLYESAFPNLDMALEGEYTVEVAADAALGPETLRNQTFKVSFSVPLTGAPTAWTVTGRYATKNLYVDGTPGATISPDAAWAEFTTAESETQVTSPLAVSARITGLKITKIHLKSSDGDIDFVRDLEFAPDLASSLEATSAASPSMVTLYPHVGCEVDDPRENLYQGSKDDEAQMNWRLIKVAAVAGTDTGTGPEAIADGFTFGAKNAFCDPVNADAAIAKDLETASDPENISSATIRNEPMKTLVELGSIPRGAKWQTINLRTSRVTPATEVMTDLETAGDTYLQGDGALLDQVKLTARVQVPHRLCINTPPGVNTPESKLLYEGLFRGLVWNWDKHYDYEYAGTALASGIATTAANVLSGRDVAADSGAQKFFSRAELLAFESGGSRLWTAYGQVTPTNDAQAETIAPLVSSLISFFPRSPDPVTLILVAQSIRDIGTPAGFSMTKLKPDGSDDTASTTVRSGQFDLSGDVYFDEITGTVRYYAEIGTDATAKKVRLLRLEPLD